jgi:hypothetical protein
MEIPSAALEKPVYRITFMALKTPMPVAEEAVATSLQPTTSQ